MVLRVYVVPGALLLQRFVASWRRSSSDTGGFQLNALPRGKNEYTGISLDFKAEPNKDVRR
jgi:hypothetical protein